MDPSTLSHPKPSLHLPLLVLILGTALYLLSPQPVSCVFLVLGVAFNLLTNPVLKWCIQQPRPREDTRLFRLRIASGERPTISQLGMPSGHAQLLSFVLVFTFLQANINNNNNNKWLLFVAMTLLSLYIVYRKEVTGQHSWTQLCAGAIVGTLVAVVFYHTSRRWMRGPLKQKQDDGFLLSRFYSFG